MEIDRSVITLYKRVAGDHKGTLIIVVHEGQGARHGSTACVGPSQNEVAARNAVFLILKLLFLILLLDDLKLILAGHGIGTDLLVALILAKGEGLAIKNVGNIVAVHYGVAAVTDVFALKLFFAARNERGAKQYSDKRQQ